MTLNEETTKARIDFLLRLIIKAPSTIQQFIGEEVHNVFSIIMMESAGIIIQTRHGNGVVIGNIDADQQNNFYQEIGSTINDLILKLQEFYGHPISLLFAKSEVSIMCAVDEIYSALIKITS